MRQQGMRVTLGLHGGKPYKEKLGKLESIVTIMLFRHEEEGDELPRNKREDAPCAEEESPTQKRPRGRYFRNSKGVTFALVPDGLGHAANGRTTTPTIAEMNAMDTSPGASVPLRLDLVPRFAEARAGVLEGARRALDRVRSLDLHRLVEPATAEERRLAAMVWGSMLMIMMISWFTQKTINPFNR